MMKTYDSSQIIKKDANFCQSSFYQVDQILSFPYIRTKKAARNIRIPSFLNSTPCKSNSC